MLEQDIELVLFLLCVLSLKTQTYLFIYQFYCTLLETCLDY